MQGVNQVLHLRQDLDQSFIPTSPRPSPNGEGACKIILTRILGSTDAIRKNLSGLAGKQERDSCKAVPFLYTYFYFPTKKLNHSPPAADV